MNYDSIIKLNTQNLIEDINGFNAVKSNDACTAMIKRSEEEFRFDKCGQRLGKEQLKCPGCKRDIALHIDFSDYEILSKINNHIEQGGLVEIKEINIDEVKKKAVKNYLVISGLGIIIFVVIYLTANLL